MYTHKHIPSVGLYWDNDLCEYTIHKHIPSEGPYWDNAPQFQEMNKSVKIAPYPF